MSVTQGSSTEAVQFERDRCPYEELGHTAEIGIRVHAATPEQLYACAALSMFALIAADPAPGSPATPREVQVTSPDPESLLVDWLNELVYLHEVHHETYTGCTVHHWEPTAIRATVMGHPLAGPPALHIKAVTYHLLEVRQDETGWHAQVVFDI